MRYPIRSTKYVASCALVGVVFVFALMKFAGKLEWAGEFVTLRDEIRQLGGEMKLDDVGDIVSVSLSDVAIRRPFFMRLVKTPGLLHLSLSRCDLSLVNDTRLDRNETLSLKSVDIESCDSKDHDWSWVNAAGNLTALRVSKSATNQGFSACLKSLGQLQLIDFTHSSVSDEVLDSLESTSLRCALLRGTKITTAGVERFVNTATKLTTLDISDTSLESLQCLRGAKAIKILELDRFTLTVDDAKILSGLERLVSLTLQGAVIRSGVFQEFKEHLHLGLLGCADCRFEGTEVITLCQLSNLGAVDLRFTTASNDEISQLAKGSGRTLGVLRIAGSKVTFLSQETITRFQKLGRLEVCSRQLDASTEANLSRLLPKCRIVYVSCETSNNGG